jgi:hypothetical protein
MEYNEYIERYCKREHPFEKLDESDAFVTGILSNMKPHQRGRICVNITEGFRMLLEMAVESEHKDWTPEQIKKETAARWWQLSYHPYWAPPTPSPSSQSSPTNPSTTPPG